MGRSCSGPGEADHRHGQDARHGQPAPGPGAPTVTASATTPARAARPASSSACAAAGGYPASGPGSRPADPGEPPTGTARCPRPRQVGLPRAKEQHQGAEHSGQRMRESRADRDPGRSGGDHQQQPAGQHRDARGADGAPQLTPRRAAPISSRLAGAAPARPTRWARVRVPAVAGKLAYRSAMAVAPGPPGGQLRGGQDGHAEDELPGADPPAGVPPQRFRRSRSRTQTTAPPASSPASTSRLRTSSDASTLARPAPSASGARGRCGQACLVVAGHSGVGVGTPVRPRDGHRAPAAWDSSR